MSTFFDADYYHLNKEPRITFERTNVALSEDAFVTHMVIASETQTKFKELVFDTFHEDTIKTGILEAKTPVQSRVSNNRYAEIVVQVQKYVTY